MTCDDCKTPLTCAEFSRCVGSRGSGRPRKPRQDTRRLSYLAALSAGPKTNRELQLVVDDIGPYVARDMARLRVLGYVRNPQPHRTQAVYEITGAGQAFIERASL